MNDFRPHEDDDEVTHGLRAIFAAPTGAAYWSDLESRIMARVAEVELGWWDELDRWMRPAMLAAAALIIAAGVAMFRADQAETEMAYEAILTPTAVPGATVDAAIRPIDIDPRDATLRVVLPP